MYVRGGHCSMKIEAALKERQMYMLSKEVQETWWAAAGLCALGGAMCAGGHSRGQG